MEQYLSLDLSYKFRKILSTFRCSTHELMIEKGRHNNIDRYLRYCPLCFIANVQAVEDEVHFFFFCPSYERIRNMYFSPHWLRNRTKESFCRIMASQTNDCVYRVAYFLYNAFQYRREFLKDIT